MFVQVTNPSYRTGIATEITAGTAAAPGTPDALIAFEQIGSRQQFARNEDIFAERDTADFWYKVISGTVRTCKLLANGRRHLAEFYFSGDCFGFDNMVERLFSAEAVDNVIVMRIPRDATARLIDLASLTMTTGSVIPSVSSSRVTATMPLPTVRRQSSSQIKDQSHHDV